MASGSASISPPQVLRARRSEPIKATALLTLRALSADELQRASRALAAEGIADLHTTQMRLTARNAKAVTQGKSGPIPATIVIDERPHSTPAVDPRCRPPGQLSMRHGHVG